MRIFAAPLTFALWSCPRTANFMGSYKDQQKKSILCGKNQVCTISGVNLRELVLPLTKWLHSSSIRQI